MRGCGAANLEKDMNQVRSLNRNLLGNTFIARVTDNRVCQHGHGEICSVARMFGKIPHNYEVLNINRRL